jgi:predicted homoserine dehydrogenase-like protein
MIIVDSALRKRQEDANPIRVGIVGAGFMGRGIALQIIKNVPGMVLAAVYSRNLADARRAYTDGDIESVQEVSSIAQLQDAISAGKSAVTDDVEVLCQAPGIDAIIEVTGTIDFAARVSIDAMNAGKHVISMNAELDATLGPILKVYAERAGVIMTTADGDQPGVIMNLLRWVQSIGFKPVLAGNMKGLQDPYRTPETQKDFAERHNQKPAMVTSFADGTKISMEMAVVANATGFKVGQRGMYGPRCKHVNETPGLFPVEQMLAGGLVDYTLGADPAPGVFIIGHNENPIQQQYMHYYKMGDGPFYVFYTPYHLCHVETPLSVARAVLFSDVVAKPIGAPVCEVIAVAKRDLQAGEILDGFGGFATYGVLENSGVCRAENLLPMGLAQSCRLKAPILKDQPLTFGDVELPAGRFSNQLWEEQRKHFKS